MLNKLKLGFIYEKDMDFFGRNDLMLIFFVGPHFDFSIKLQPLPRATQ